MKQFLTAIAAFFIAITGTTPAHAAYPDSPISIVLPYAPGGAADTLLRFLSQHLSTKLNNPVIVVNKSGASGIIGQNSVVQAKADGYTLLYDATPYSINPLLQKLNYDPLTDLIPVTQVSDTAMLLVVPKNSPYSSIQDIIKAARANPGKLTFGSGGQGTVQFMAGELFSQGAGVNMLHIPFKSGGPAIVAVVGGQVDMMFSNLPAISNLVNKGELKALAITSTQRHPNFPNVPTVEESGIKGYSAYEWNGIFAPKGTSPEIINNLQRAIKAILDQPEVQERFDALGTTRVGSTPEEFKKYLSEETAKWAKVVKQANIQPQ